MKIRFTKHAEEKFEIMERHGFVITREQVLEAVSNPDLVDRESRPSQNIAQVTIDKNHVLRVVYRIENGDRVIITFYPGRTKQYGKK